jgi:hypothetical protein
VTAAESDFTVVSQPVYVAELVNLGSGRQERDLWADERIRSTVYQGSPSAGLVIRRYRAFSSYAGGHSFSTCWGVGSRYRFIFICGGWIGSILRRYDTHAYSSLIQPLSRQKQHRWEVQTLPQRKTARRSSTLRRILSTRIQAVRMRLPAVLRRWVLI